MLGLSFLLHTHADREPPSSAIGKVHAVLSNLQHTNKPTAIMSIACLVFLLGARIAKGHLVKRPGGRWLRYVPEILLVVVGTTCECIDRVQPCHPSTSKADGVQSSLPSSDLIWKASMCSAKFQAEGKYRLAGRWTSGDWAISAIR